MNNKHLTDDQIRSRYPRLLRSMIRAACLSEGEAIHAIRIGKAGEDLAGEAVNHFGGVRAVIGAGIWHRKAARILLPQNTEGR